MTDLSYIRCVKQYVDNNKFKLLVDWIVDGSGTVERAKANYGLDAETEDALRRIVTLKERLG